MKEITSKTRLKTKLLIKQAASEEVKPKIKTNM